MLFTFPHSKRQKNKLPLTIDLFGFHHLQEPIVRNHTFTLHQWIYCEDGIGEFILNGKKFILNPGEIVLIYAHEPHSYHAITEEWHVHIIGFSGINSLELLKTFRMHESGIYHFKNPDIFTDYFQKIFLIQKRIQDESNLAGELKKKKKRSRISSVFLIELSKLCYDFLLELSVTISFVSSSIPASDNEIIKSMISYMEEHFRESISLDQIAEHVNLSKSYISVVFKQHMQQTILQYLTNLRISQARILLIEYPEIRAAEIGKMCGFENPSYFGETFKKIVGQTPVEYRLR